MNKVGARILEVNKDGVTAALETVGAKKVDDTILAVDVYDTREAHVLDVDVKQGALSAHTFAIFNALRDLIDSSTMNVELEWNANLTNVRIVTVSEHGGGKETTMAINLLPTELETIKRLLIKSGFKKVGYWQKKRTSYVYGSHDLRYDIDTWPSVPTYVEINANHDDELSEAAKLIGFKRSNLREISDAELFKRYSASPIYMSFADEEMAVSHEDLVGLMNDAIQRHAPHLTPEEVRLIAEHYLFAEYSGKKTHGLRKFCWDVQFYKDRLDKPRLIKESFSMALLDGQREIGPIAANLSADIVITKAKENGVAIVGMTTAQRFGVLSTWTEKIAKAGLIGILTTSTEPFTALSETATGVVGTNPISISIPYKQTPIVYDAALSKAPVNMIWLNRLLGMELPDKTFLNDNGEYTTDPYRGRYVDVFGGPKGSGLAIMLQIMSGPLMGIASHESFGKPYENAFYFQAIDPAFFQPMDQFQERVEGFIAFAQQAPLRKGYEALHIPGEPSRQSLEQVMSRGRIRVHTGVAGWLEFLGSD